MSSRTRKPTVLHPMQIVKRDALSCRYVAPEQSKRLAFSSFVRTAYPFPFQKKAYLRAGACTLACARTLLHALRNFLPSSLAAMWYGLRGSLLYNKALEIINSTS